MDASRAEEKNAVFKDLSIFFASKFEDKVCFVFRYSYTSSSTYIINFRMSRSCLQTVKI